MSEAATPYWRTIPPVVAWLAGAFVVAYAAFSLAPIEIKNLLFYHFAVIPLRFEAGAGPDRFHGWLEPLGPLLGHVFLHGGWLHLGMNTLVFLQAGPVVARRLGARRFLILFFAAAIGGAAGYILINSGSVMPAVGASGAICGVFGSYFLAVRSSWRAALRDPQIRNAITFFLLINVVLAGLARVSGFLPIAWEAHLGGFLVGLVAYPVLAPKARGPWG